MNCVLSTFMVSKVSAEQGTALRNIIGNDTVFDDLNLSKKEYPQVPTTW
jgi:uroporphyrinogen-III synthase